MKNCIVCRKDCTKSEYYKFFYNKEINLCDHNCWQKWIKSNETIKCFICGKPFLRKNIGLYDPKTKKYLAFGMNLWGFCSHRCERKFYNKIVDETLDSPSWLKVVKKR